MTTGDVHTFCRYDYWLNEIEGSQSLRLQVERTKKAAVTAGRRLARSRGVTQVIHNRRGDVEARVR